MEIIRQNHLYLARHSRLPIRRQYIYPGSRPRYRFLPGQCPRTPIEIFGRTKTDTRAPQRTFQSVALVAF